LPKRKTAEHGERHIQKKKYESEPEDIGADEELRFGFDQLLQLLLREVLVRGKQKDAAELDDHQAAKPKTRKTTRCTQDQGIRRSSGREELA